MRSTLPSPSSRIQSPLSMRSLIQPPLHISREGIIHTAQVLECCSHSQHACLAGSVQKCPPLLAPLSPAPCSLTQPPLRINPEGIIHGSGLEALQVTH
jgi:hypothetical protein